MTHNIHPHSIVSFHTMDKSGRRVLVLSAYEYNKAYTDRQICYRLGFSDLNAVRPRITEAIDDGVLIECGKTKDDLTNRQVRLTKITKKQEQMEMSL